MNKAKPHKYEYNIDLDGDSAAANVIRLVRRGSKVLEIGAGPGSITKCLSGLLECDVTAVEIDPESLSKLPEFARAVHSFDLNSETWADELRALEGTFDFVIAADVLEHVLAPGKVLAGMASLLNEQGSVILSLPHAGHATVVSCLLDEDFEYREWGLLDKTHIRFFGIKNIQSLYEKQGLAIEEAAFVVRTPEMTEFAHRWVRMPSDVRAAIQRNRFSHVYQVVTRAVPVSRADKKLRLVHLPVIKPDASVKQYWKGIMAAIKPLPDGDQTSTFVDRPRRAWPFPFGRKSDKN